MVNHKIEVVRMKKGVFFLVSFILFVSFVYSVPTDEQIQQAANTLGVPFADLKQFVQSYQPRNMSNEAIQVDIARIIDDYKANVARAENRYKGKNLEITGVIRVIDTDKITLSRSRNAYDYVFIYFQQSESNKIINLDIGQTITIVGRCERGDNDGWVYIQEAYIAR
jgi:hypothetical protein